MKEYNQERVWPMILVSILFFIFILVVIANIPPMPASPFTSEKTISGIQFLKGEWNKK